MQKFNLHVGFEPTDELNILLGHMPKSTSTYLLLDCKICLNQYLKRIYEFEQWLK